MRARIQFVVLLLIAASCSAQVVDRMVAVVNKRVILESELEQAARVEFLMSGKPLAQLTRAEKVAVLNRLIDRSLLEQQIARTEMLDPTPEELAARLAELRNQLPGVQSDEGWHKVLHDYELSQQDIEDSLKSQIRILRFIDMRFRGLVRVEPNDVEAYYRDKLVPQLRSQGSPEPPLAEVSAKIENILVEQGIDEMLERWLETLRGQAHIEKMISLPASAGNGARP
jgi:peptidyl-prolyl cis-trans isomerase SurA